MIPHRSLFLSPKPKAHSPIGPRLSPEPGLALGSGPGQGKALALKPGPGVAAKV